MKNCGGDRSGEGRGGSFKGLRKMREHGTAHWELLYKLPLIQSWPAKGLSAYNKKEKREGKSGTHLVGVVEEGEPGGDISRTAKNKKGDFWQRLIKKVR